MISSAEIRRIAGKNILDPMIIERDYVLGCYLHYLANESVLQESWIFKGGTCLRKCYFPNYRFSEDLDFTMHKALTLSELKEIIYHVNHLVQTDQGILLDTRKTLVEIVEDEYGKETYEVKVYYRGPLNFRGSAPALRIHLTRFENIVFPIMTLPFYHPYSDQNSLPKTKVKTYSLEEMFAEKLRAFSGQRKYAISRDIYDIYMLTDNNIQKHHALEAFRQKCSAKGILCEKIDLNKIAHRKREFELNWKHNLEYLVPENQKISFDIAWNHACGLLKQAIECI